MYRHSEQRHLAHPPEAIFDLVADVSAYPEFLPWCTATRILKQSESEMIAEMAVGYKGIREIYKSDVQLDREGLAIAVSAIDGPFKTLDNRWRFSPSEEGGCEVDFSIEFEFRSWLLQRVIGAFFEQAVGRMVAAFEARADALYPAKNPD
ncbi:MAG TPA: ubiquinone-binding protein [Rhodospirillaceae bacterium]|nr:ubiquinone-binding protein [Rhodospirillaceae bacterium]HAA93722.1 ubiquinone-binding protein [Rhodospirillaceae bacterium]HAT34226.1 ubiquinone-binding protein [Rhodospirillaceae bacterium]|tara:strand:+ start:156 stop:605 length:450 start_codon:yes stop_codon:yes gene_type:complete